MSVSWAAHGTCYTKTEGTELGDIELQCSSNFFKVGKGEGGGGGKGDVDRLWGHLHVMPAMALWLTCSHVELFCNVVSRFEVLYFLKLW